jgi:ABC-type nitrate/sulfonate/bicarbonate transport system substrate-binding protein
MDKKPPFDASHDPASSRKVLIRLVIVAALSRALAPAMAEANPFLAKAGDTTTTVQVVTCAVSGDFIHLYAAMDNGLFDKYAIKVEHKFISGSAMNLAAPKPRKFTSY